MRLSLVRRIYIRPRYSPIYPGYKVAEGSKPESFTVENPANGATLSTIVTSTPEDVKACVDQADQVFKSGVWSRSSIQHRSSVLSKLSRSLASRIPEISEIETLQTGRPIREMRAQIGRVTEWLDYFASLIRVNQGYVAPTFGSLHNYVNRIPLGVVAQITPFNHPLFIAMKKIAPALAAGNSVVLKPSEHAPLSLFEFANLAYEAGVPEGVFTMLPGPGPTTAVDLIKHPLIRKVDLTGGTRAGKAVGALVGANVAHFTAELGGKAPMLIFNDADVVSAVNGAAFASFIAAGQTCVSGTRLLLQDGIYEQFMDLFLAKVESITKRMGDPMNPNSSMGCLITKASRDRVHAMVSRGGGTILTGGAPMEGPSPLDGFDLSKGAFYPPTIITDIDLQSELWKEEIFGPVVVVQRFRSDAVGLQLANDCKYGLGASIWTTDVSKAHRVADAIEAGIVWVNTHHRNDPSSPWGGMKDSGIGRENGLEALESYSQSKTITINTASAEEMRQDDWFNDEGSRARYG